MRARAKLLALLIGGGSVAAGADDYLPIAGAELRSALPKQGTVAVANFLLQRHPVTNAEFLAFTATHPQWRRSAVPALFAGTDYLGHWQSDTELGAAALPQQPVTRISWFAATAYCEAQDARLPTWFEWELAAAADASRRDARSDPAWRQRILDWYAHPSAVALQPVEQTPANIYGLYDLHGLIWEWVQDFNSLTVGSPGSERNGSEKFCGSGALSLEQKENYAVQMRIAMLGSLRAADTGRALGFRCARNAGDANR